MRILMRRATSRGSLPAKDACRVTEGISKLRRSAQSRRPSVVSRDRLISFRDERTSLSIALKEGVMDGGQRRVPRCPRTPA